MAPPRSLSPDLRLTVVLDCCTWLPPVPRPLTPSVWDNSAQHLFPKAWTSRVYQGGRGKGHPVTGPDPKNCPCPLYSPNPVPPASLPHSLLSISTAGADSGLFFFHLGYYSSLLLLSLKRSPGFSRLGAGGPCELVIASWGDSQGPEKLQKIRGTFLIYRSSQNVVGDPEGSQES